MYKPYHLIGLELNVSVLSAALRGEATGQPRQWMADVVATAKRDLRAGEVLDGEGGYTVWGRLMPAAASVALGGLPIGLAHGVELVRDVAAGAAGALGRRAAQGGTRRPPPPPRARGRRRRAGLMPSRERFDGRRSGWTALDSVGAWSMSTTTAGERAPGRLAPSS